MGQDTTCTDDTGADPAGAAAGFSGCRVAWLGPAQAGVSSAYWASPGAGDRQPRPDELTQVAVGEHGTVGELLRVSETGHWYVIRFDTGHELETVLPAPGLVDLDPAGQEAAAPVPVPRPARYAPSGRWLPFLRRARQHGL